MSVKVKTNGPFFNEGNREREVSVFLENATLEVAQEGVNLVQNELGRVLKNPTGYYRSNITTDNRANGFAVTDGGVVYGPWLEGVGSRNSRSRFKGYSTFRRMLGQLESKVDKIAEPEADKLVSRLS